MQILVVGSVALDDIQTPFGKRLGALGGSASHFSLAASLLSLVRIVAVVGQDFPRRYLDHLKKRGVDIAGIRLTTGETFRWRGHYEFDMNTAFTDETRLGVFATFNPELSLAERKAPVLFLGNIDPEIQLKVLKQMESPLFVGLDSMNFWIEQKKKELLKVIRRVDALFLNDAEVRQLAGEASLIKAGRHIQKLGPKMVLIKKGEHGVVCISRKFTFVAAAYPTEDVKDPTGAGDSFAGGVVSYLFSRLGPKISDPSEEIIRQAVIWGAAVASFCVEDFGTKGLDNLTRQKVQMRCHRIFEHTRFEPHD
ncbi:MAG: PfkB family carbohydrate kinase [Leptospiraceae bacterium]|nr:PfkB family carbohydrate kinase [Leptospiraceae bacterium]MDW8305497.1 PfkB family carbohydrate kinase [Leptospiraceae bacterium]